MKEKISWEQVQEMIQGYELIQYAAPVMIGLVILEWVYSLKRNRNEQYDIKDTLASTAVGLGNVTLSAIIKIVLFTVVLFFYNMVPWSIPPGWFSFILCLLWIDFWRYWAHRIAHTSRIWWATHITHHNSQKYNWSVSFRLGWTQYFKIIFFIPVALAGFDPVTFFICHQITVLYQFWIHTEYIKKLPAPIEFIFVTPSHHRVHHCSNVEYLDKNFGSTFIFWDRMFGTFQEELPDVQKKYGITKEVKKPYNPLYIIFHEWSDLIRDVRKAKTWKDRWRYIAASPSRVAEWEEEQEKKKEEESSPAIGVEKEVVEERVA